MAKFLSLILGVGIEIIVALPAAGQGATCLAANAYSDHVMQNAASVASGADSVSARLRTAFHLPAVGTDQVTLVATDSICALAAAAFFGSFSSDNGTARPVWVLKVGTSRYIVFDGQHQVGGRDIQVVLDEDFNYLAAILG